MAVILPALAAALTTALLALLGIRARAFRAARNFEGLDVPIAGAAAAAGIIAGLLAARVPDATSRATLAAALGFAFFGLLDDLYGDRSASGFLGHLGALRRGRVTTGAMKVLGGGLTALIAARLLGAAGLPWLVEGAIIALSANALNLVDTRPVRAAAVFLAAALFLWPYAPAAGCAAIPAAAVWLPFDRRRIAMLGDAGSNALGAILGVWVAEASGFRAALGVLIALIAFHAWTEGHSINRAIAANPRLDRLDGWMRGEGRPRSG
ncbi:MAG TPA: hypothetical protein VGM37_21685 [Armatimonadota bacterium]|jgi:hypothetical protein